MEEFDNMLYFVTTFFSNIDNFLYKIKITSILATEILSIMTRKS